MKCVCAGAGPTSWIGGIAVPQQLNPRKWDASSFIEYRQVLAVDAQGRAAIHSGTNSLGIRTRAKTENVASDGNPLDNDMIPHAIVDGFPRPDISTTI